MLTIAIMLGVLYVAALVDAALELEAAWPYLASLDTQIGDGIDTPTASPHTTAQGGMVPNANPVLRPPVTDFCQNTGVSFFHEHSE